MINLNLDKRHESIVFWILNTLKNDQSSAFIDDVILYGSCARGEAQYSSDVDIAILTSNSKYNTPYFRRLLDNGDYHLPDVDVHAFLEKGNDTYWTEIIKEGISLWV